MRRIKRTFLTATAAGSAGASVGESNPSERVNGIVLAIYIERGANPVATTDIAIYEANAAPPLPVFTLANIVADRWYYPRIALHNAADGSGIVGPVDYVTVDNALLLEITGGGNDGTIINAYVLWEPASSD